MALMTTESSFVGFQLLLLLLLLPYVAEKWLKWCGWAVVLLCLVFTKSGTVVVLAAVYFGLWGLFSLRRRLLVWLAAAVSAATGAAILANGLSPAVRTAASRLVGAVFSVYRLKRMSISFQIRYHYLINLVYALQETHGVGLGIGQYGYFWKAIYLRHIDYTQFDPTGEMAQALSTTGSYMKPWSAILGIGVDLGIIGLALLVGFFWQVYRALAGPRHRALFFACLVGLAWAYPIITPHIWLALALMAGLGLEQKQKKVAA